MPSSAWDDVCDYPLARNLVTLAVAVACEALLRYVSNGTRESFTFTLEDFTVRRFEV